MNNSNTQKGSFTVELSFVLVGLCLIYLFSTDLSHKLLMQSALDRTSFALVNILKERTRYYQGDIQKNTNLDVEEQQRLDMQKLAARLLNQDVDSVMINIQSLVGEVVSESETLQTDNCTAPEIYSEGYKELVPVEEGLVYPLYSVTVCETYPSWFGVFANSSETLTLSSTSVMPGR